MSSFTYKEYDKAFKNQKTIDDFFKKVSSSDFYFKVWNDEESLYNVATFAVFVAKVFYDKEKCLDDRTPQIEHLLPSGLFECCESTFNTEKTVEELKKELIELGFEENERLCNEKTE